MEQVPVQKKLVAIYFMIVSLDSISFCLIAPILAHLLVQNSVFFAAFSSEIWRYGVYGLLIALFPLAYMLGSSFLGKLSDNLGRNRVLTVCLFLMLFAFIAYATAFHVQSLTLFMAGRIMAGLAAASQSVAQAAMTDCYEIDKKSYAISLIAVAMTIGLVFGPLVASLWNNVNNRLVFGIAIVLTAVNILLLLYYGQKNNPIHKDSQLPITEKPLLKDTQLIQLLGVFLLFELGWSMYYQALPLMLSAHWNLDSHKVGLIYAFVGASLALFLLGGPRLGLKFMALPSLIFTGFLIGIGALVSALSSVCLLYFILATVPTTLAVALIYPGLITEISNRAAQRQGFVLGITGALLALAFACTGFFSSLLLYVRYYLPTLVALACWIMAGLWYLWVIGKT